MWRDELDGEYRKEVKILDSGQIYTFVCCLSPYIQHKLLTSEYMI